jgi:hypothetical protein
MCVGEEWNGYTNTIAYTLDIGNQSLSCIAPLIDDVGGNCPIHGHGCVGHVESNVICTFIPTNMTRSSADRQHPLMQLKQRCINGVVDPRDYRMEVVKHMRSKTGHIRSMNSIVVEGSLKMVISAIPHTDQSTISIPQHIAGAIRVPHVINGRVVVSPVRDGDYGILVRQPVLWHGGIRPCRIRVTANVANTPGTWDVNCSMVLPISMCSTFGSDFDGDEMTLFPVRTHRAIEVCKASIWNNSARSPYSEEGYNSIVPRGAPNIGTRSNTMALATTVCWTDRTSGYRVGKHHSKWMTSASSMIRMKHEPLTAREFGLLGMKSMASSSMKSSLQSDIGATSRRAKLGAERIYLNANRCLTCQTGEFSTLVPTMSRYPPPRTDGYFGNPSVRAVSRLCAASMQITLKVKSSSSISNTSPTLSLLSGSKEWVCILKSGTIDIVSESHAIPYDHIDVTCSLFDISRAPQHVRHRLTGSFIRMVYMECRCSFDKAEYECLIALIMFITSMTLTPDVGIETNINRFYGEFSTVPRWNMCYPDRMYMTSSSLTKTGTTLVEHMMLGTFADIRSIAGDFP